jgi:glucose-6-phosphate isomerase
MTNNTNTSSALQRIITEDAVGQLRRRDGRMAKLGSENGELKLDWVEGVARLLADPGMLEEVEAEARDIWQRGIRHIIWAGMGGSVLTVRVLTSLGFCRASSHETGQIASTEQITIYPLDSTDPAALNAIVRQIAGGSSQGDRAEYQGDRAEYQGDREGRPYNTTEQFEDQSLLRLLLADVLMIGVSMGMTSEEPITHLAWFADLLSQAQLSLAEHLMVMTLPGSYLDQFAQERRAPSRPLQPDKGTGTGGRMSAPATRVFLLPAALALINESCPPGSLRAMLRRAWEMYNFELASERPAEHPFVRLAAAMSDASLDGVCLLLVAMPTGWDALVSWLEQLMEESLGKGGKGVVVFEDQQIKSTTEKDEGDRKASYPTQINQRLGFGEKDLSNNLLTVHVTPKVEIVDFQHTQSDKPFFVLSQPYLAATDASERLAALAASFMGWQLSMALFGYLHDITFAGQPAVENYKTRARVLRMQENPLSVLEHWGAHYTEGMLTLYGPQETISQAPGERGRDGLAKSMARVLREAHTAQRLAYLDGTINGEASPAFLAMFGQYLRRIGNESLGVPVKLRRAPADYHSTEQSEMDGPMWLVSLRLLARQHERCMIGRYDDTFLLAQAVSTWQAMLEQGRSCFLLVVDGALEDAMEPVAQFFERVISVLESQ